MQHKIYRANIDRPLGYAHLLEPEAQTELRHIANACNVPVAWVEAVIAHETAGTFAPDICTGNKRWAELDEATRENRGVGLLQWTNVGVVELNRLGGISIGKPSLAAMTQAQQMRLVGSWYASWSRSLYTLGDVYAVVLWPAAVGKGRHYVLSMTEVQLAANRGLDLNKDGKVTLGEIEARVKAWVRET